MFALAVIQESRAGGLAELVSVVLRVLLLLLRRIVAVVVRSDLRFELPVQVLLLLLLLLPSVVMRLAVGRAAVAMVASMLPVLRRWWLFVLWSPMRTCSFLAYVQRRW